MVKSMRPVLDMSWSTLTLDFYTSSSWLKRSEDIEAMFKIFLRISNTKASNGDFFLQRTKRLVLLLPDEPRCQLHDMLEVLRALFLFIRGLLRDLRGSLRIRQAWSYTRPSARDTQWHLVLDFEKGLEKPPRVLYRIQKTGVQELTAAGARPMTFQI